MKEKQEKYKMGNILDKHIKTIEYTDYYRGLDSTEINRIRENYKVVDVDWLGYVQVNSTIYNDDYFLKNPRKKEIIQDILDYYLTHEDKAIYKKTDYLCNEREKLCICNIHADDFRKIYDRHSYKPEDKFISWCKMRNSPF